MNRRSLASLLAAALLAGASAVGGVIDRHPEARSRARAWTEFDGSFLVDPNSRADMLNFYWTVLARPYPEVNWTGSTEPAVAGETAEAWRVREYAQLNACRALNFSRAMAEDPQKLPLVQEGALVLALNPERPVTHAIDASWSGYNAASASALATSLIGGAGRFLLTGAVDGLINDPGSGNAALVGHRTVLLHDGNVTGTAGAAYAAPINYHFAVWHCPAQFQAAPPGSFIAWPAPGFMPAGLFRTSADPARFRWSFVPATDQRDFDSLRNATVSARLRGVELPVRNLARNFNPYPLTWEFDPADFSFARVGEDAAIEIEIANVMIGGSPRRYRYTVTVFDEGTIRPVGFRPQSPLINVSTRGRIGRGEEAMIAGLVVTGRLPVRVALRTQGPSLVRFGLANPARGIRLRLYAGDGSQLGENTGWRDHPDWRLLQSLGVAPAEDTEAGLVATLWPGSYTAVASTEAGSEGIGLVEVFNIDNLTTGRCANLATRGVVGADENRLIAGFVVGERPRPILVRTQGPGLARLGVANTVDDPRLTVVAQEDGRIVGHNDDWQTEPGNARLAADLAAFAPTDPREAALLLTLPPGAYTALLSSPTNAGIGLVEVFEVPEP